VAVLTNGNFDSHLEANGLTLVKFYAPWCGHCKAMAPEFEKAAEELEGKVSLGKVDATVEEALGTRFGIESYPTMKWFEHGEEHEYDGPRDAEGIVAWTQTAREPAVVDVASEDEVVVKPGKPTMVLYGEPHEAFTRAASAKRQAARWYRVPGKAETVMVRHYQEDPIEFVEELDVGALKDFLADNLLPRVGMLNTDSYDQYYAKKMGLLACLYPMRKTEDTEAKVEPYRADMLAIAKAFPEYYVVYTNTEDFAEALDEIFGVKKFPSFVVKTKVDSKRKFILDGEFTAESAVAFVKKVEAGEQQPTVKSEMMPPGGLGGDDPMKYAVGDNVEELVFQKDKDVFLEIFAPWCGHCKQLAPEYEKIALKVERENLQDMVVIAKMDGTANDAPVEEIDWAGFPTLLYFKAGDRTPTKYKGGPSAKGLWHFIRTQHSRAAELTARIDENKRRRSAEL